MEKFLIRIYYKILFVIWNDEILGVIVEYCDLIFGVWVIEFKFIGKVIGWLEILSSLSVIW